MTYQIRVERFQPTSAVEFLSRRVAMTPRDYCSLHPADRPAAFTIAGIHSRELIEALRREILSCLRDGDLFRDFYRRVLVHFARHPVNPLSQWRLEILFRTTLSQSYVADRVSQMLHPAVRAALPYWQYSTIGDSQVRRSHTALDGFIARWDDPVWLTILPPNGPCCRCKVRALLASQARERAGKDALDIPGADRLPAGLRIQYPVSVLPFILGERPFLRR